MDEPGVDPTLEDRGGVLVPGLSCWKRARADHLSLIQDAGPAFSAIAAALEQAQQTIFILGWDLDSRTVLRPDRHLAAERNLLPLLCRCLDRRPALQIFVLCWDFSFIYSFEREPRPRSQFGRAHPRLHFSLDSDHGSGGSHHQKVVVVDDTVAFLGGVDLTTHRWDTPAHRPVEQDRVDVDGAPYQPFHDVHAAVSGPAAATLGLLARDRWQRGRRRPSPPPLSIGNAPGPKLRPDAWSPGLDPVALDIEVALARTSSAPGQPAVREIQALSLRAIAAARRWIYVENQYFTSGAIARALAKRLAEAQGPEVVLLLPQVESGWMEQSSMGVLRAQALAYLLKHDIHKHLRVVSPVVSAAQGGTVQIAVHSKVLVVDDLLAKVGSSNFSNRSMGLDSECDLAVEAYDTPSTAFVASVRNRLLAEHLGLPVADVAAQLARHGSLLRLVDDQPPAAPRALRPTSPSGVAPFDFTVLDGAMVDPPEPWNAELLAERAVPVPFRRHLARRWLRPLCLAAVGLVAWFLLYHARLNGDHIQIAARPGRLCLATLGYAIAGTAFVPFTLLATLAVSVLGLWPGVLVAWCGGIISATLSHLVGGSLGTRTLSWLPTRIQSTLPKFLSRHAFWSVVFMRMAPLGNFGLLNTAAGALAVPLRSFVLANMVGLLPGLVGLGFIVNQVLATARRPGAFNIALTVTLMGLVTALSVWARRRFTSSRAKR